MEPITVLHVDDNASFARLGAKCLEQEQGAISVVVETSATAALDRLESEPVDAVVSDYRMPDMGGIEFLEAVRTERPDLPFILFTGRGSEEVASEAIAAGVTDYLRKTNGIEQFTLLANRLVNAVERYRARQRAAEQERINDVVRRVNEALVRAKAREPLEARVTDVLTDSAVYRFAWMGHHDPERGIVEPTTYSGVEEGYLDEIRVTTADEREGRGPAGRALRTDEVAVSQTVTDDPAFEPWREAAAERGYASVAAVPLSHAGSDYGVLAVYSGREYAFDADERTMLADVGANVGHALAALERERELHRQNERLEEFASIVSHDLRNPLNLAQGRLEMARAERDGENLATVDRALGRIDRLIEDVLSLARQGQAPEDVGPVSLERVAEEAWKTAVGDAGDLVVASDPGTVEADESRLRRLLENLFRNTLEHAGPAPRATLGSTEAGFYVADDGPGIDEDVRDRVFEPGYTTADDGTGFGLAIVQQIADAHGWEVEVAGRKSGASDERSESEARQGGCPSGARFEITTDAEFASKSAPHD